MTRVQSAFIGLIAVQAAHSVEEYIGKLYAVFPPAIFVSGLVSENLDRGFAILNVALVSFGLSCFLFPVLRRWPSAIPICWGWTVIEIVNGVGHPFWSLRQCKYVPGTATAPLLFVVAIYLASQLRKASLQPTSS